MIWQQLSRWFVNWCPFRDDSRLKHSQWETSLQSNVASHWLGAKLESALRFGRIETGTIITRILQQHGQYLTTFSETNRAALLVFTSSGCRIMNINDKILCEIYKRHRGFKSLSVETKTSVETAFLVSEMHQSLLEFPHHGSVYRTLMFSLLLAYNCCWTNSWVATDFEMPWRSCDVIVMQ